MAILENFTLAEARELKDFKQLALGTHNATRDIIESLLHSAQPTELKDFQESYVEFQAAYLKKRDYVLRNGVSTPDIEDFLKTAETKYMGLKKKFGADPALAFLDSPIHRKEFEVEPYEIDGKHKPPNPYPGMTSAMDGIWPGYDKPEYFEQYPFLRRYEASNPGKALQAFLRDHNMFFHMPETVSRYGVMFVPPPYLDDDLNVELRQHLSKCDKIYNTAPTVKPSTTVEEARIVLSYVEDDMVAVVQDEGGTCVGVVGWADLAGQSAGEIVNMFCQRGWDEAPPQEMNARDTFEHMEKNDIPFMLQFSEHGPRIVTQTTAAISHFLPPNMHKTGFGSAIYFGISDVAEGDRLIQRLNAEADGVPAAIVETAHADTQYFRTILRHYRQQLRDVFLMAGTTIDPEAVLEFLGEYEADGVKLGIAEGHACRTSDTGIALPNAHVGLECGAVAFDRGYLMLDGWGGSGEFIKGLAMSGVQLRQGGGAFMGRREAANPSIRVNGGPRGKFYRGMAGADVQQSVLGHKDQSLTKRMEAMAHLHSEGAEVFVPQRSPSTVGRMLLAHMFLLKSAMSYEGVRAEVQENVMRQFHRLAKLYAVPTLAS